jgi:hypothetical protein
MKLFGLTCLAALLAASSIFADDHIEIGSLITKNGARVSAVYCIIKGCDTEVHLIFPDGRNIQVDVAAGTSTSTMDRALQQIADGALSTTVRADSLEDKLVKLPAIRRLEDDPIYRERLRYKLLRQRRTSVAQSME